MNCTFKFSPEYAYIPKKLRETFCDLVCSPHKKSEIEKRQKGKKKSTRASPESESAPIHLNPIALRTTKILWSFGCSECNRLSP